MVEKNLILVSIPDRRSKGHLLPQIGYVSEHAFYFNPHVQGIMVFIFCCGP